MNSSNYRFTLDMHSAQSQISLPALLGDTGRTLYISFSDGGKPYIIADGCLAKLSIKRPTGTHLEEFCTIESNTTVVYPFSKNKNTCAVAGIHNCDVTLYDPEGKKITSAKFTMVVSERAINRDDIDVTDEDYTAVDAILAVEAARQVAEAERTEAEAERLSAEEERQRAEIERTSAESERSISEEERKTAESNRAAKDIERDNKIANAVAASTHAVSVSTDAKEVVSQLSEEVAGFRTEIGNEALIFDQDTIKGAVNLAMNNAVAAKGQSDDNRTALASLSAQVAGVARTYVVPDFRSFINFLNALYSVVLKEDRDGDGVEEIYNIYVTDLITGDNIIITETNVPDFWFEKNSALTSFESYTYSGVQYNLNASVNGATIGAAHILETDYSVIEEHASSASASASSAATSAANALQSKNDAKAASDKAKASEVAAKESETAAASSATQAKNSADVAKAAEANVMNLEQRVSRNDKRITNIERGSVPEAFETDSSVAYVKDVPTEALPFAAVNTLGGMTRKCTNLIPYPYYEGMSATVSGITFVVNDSGGININGTATDVVNFVLVEENASFLPPNANISLSLKNGTDSVYLVTGGAGSALPLAYSNNYSATAPSDGVLGYCLIQVKAGTGVSNLTVYPMINEGATALPYEPFFEGLRSAPTEKVESVGVNLFDKSKVDPTYCTPTETGFKFANNNQQGAPTTLGKLKEIVPHVKAGDTITMECSVVNGSPIMYLSGSKRDVYRLNPITILEADLNDNVFVYGNAGVVCQYNEVSFCRGATAQPYRPYTRNTLPIPEAVRPAHGINENVYDYIEWCEDGTSKSYKRVGKVDLGALKWNVTSGYESRFNAIITNAPDIKGATSNVICSKYSSGGDKKLFIYESRIYVDDADYTDVTAFKNAMSGVMLYYELATPEVTDISDILPADNYIGVEGGGTLTFKNQYEFDVPSEVTYQIKEATV